MDYDLWSSVHFNPGNDPTKQNTKIGYQLMQCSAVEGECSVTCCSENALAFKRFRGLSSMANVCALVLMWNWALELFSFQFQTGNCWIYSNALLCFRMGPPSRVVSDYTLWDKLQLGRQAVVENLHRDYTSVFCSFSWERGLDYTNHWKPGLRCLLRRHWWRLRWHWWRRNGATSLSTPRGTQVINWFSFHLW